ncbi:MAG: NmrA family NAD(P)-binding protein [Litorimonas sp.]
MSSDINQVVVLGASADQGVPLISALREAGLTPIAAARRLDAMKTTPFPDIETVFADLNDQASLEKAFTGHDALAMHLPFEHNREKAASFGKNIAGAAKAARLKKIVFNTSCYVADHDLEISAHDGRRDIKQAIIDSGVNHVFIEPVVFMNNMVAPWCKPSIVNHNLFAYPASETLKISFISLSDVGRLMAAALKTDKVDGTRVRVGGPKPMTGFEVAKILSKVSGKKITFNSLPPNEFAANISELVTGSRDIPEGSVYNGMARFYHFYNRQETSPLEIDPSSFLDKLPVELMSFEDWASAYNWD